jgi:two-component system, NtrC family, sensor histidine kinase PilS
MRSLWGRSGAARQATASMPSAREVLQWMYVGRIMVALVVFIAAAFSFQAVPPATIVVLAVAAIASVAVSGLSVWHTHVRAASAGRTFLYSQALFDLALVTTVVHVTDGADSQFPALYVLVIATSAVLMPMASSLLVTSLASLLYLADIVWWQPIQLSVAVWLQIAVFVGVFMATGVLAGRLHVVGVEHEVLQKEVQRLKLEAGDILRNIGSGVVTVDGDGRLVYANPAAQELLGLFGFDILGRSFSELMGDRSPELLGAIETIQETERKHFRAEGRVQLHDREFPIGVTVTSIDLEDDGRPSVTAIFTDISNVKRIEELHTRTQRLEAVAELSASLAHEIKNPLASIRSSVEQLSRSAQAGDDERFLGQLVVRESDRLSRLLTEFLDFSRVRVANRQPLELGHVVSAAVDVVRRHPDCPAEVQIDVGHEKVLVEGDEDLLHRIVVNLVLNAVQASDGQAKIVVEARQARPGELPPGVALDGPVLLRVADNGPGIPHEIQARLFDPFVSGRVGGSGLGLAIVQRAVEAHRGVVLVDSKEGEGTVFSVLLPGRGMTEVAA